MKNLILAVDDEPLYLRLLKVNLEPEGFEVITTTNGEQAVEFVAVKKPQLVILDLMMPKMDGITACERIRQFSSVPIIMLTAKGEEHDRIKGFKVGADDYVVKPFSVTELIARVRAVLRRVQPLEEETQSRFLLMAIFALILRKPKSRRIIRLYIFRPLSIACFCISPIILGKCFLRRICLPLSGVVSTTRIRKFCG